MSYRQGNMFDAMLLYIKIKFLPNISVRLYSERQIRERFLFTFNTIDTVTHKPQARTFCLLIFRGVVVVVRLFC